MAASPTQLSLDFMRKKCYICDVVERWIPGANIRKDLFGFIDILCIKEHECVGIQTTSYSHVSERVKKISYHENIGAVRLAGMAIWVHGWRKVNGRWTVKEVNLS